MFSFIPASSTAQQLLYGPVNTQINMNVQVKANQNLLCSAVGHLFVFLCASRIIFGFAEPEQSFQSVLHGHVGLPKHQQVFAVEVWVNWIQIKAQLCSLNASKGTIQSFSGLKWAVVPSSAFRKNSKAWKRQRSRFSCKCGKTVRSLSEWGGGSDKHQQRGAALTSSYVEVGGEEKMMAATFCWYHGSSAKEKHLRDTDGPKRPHMS